MKCTHPLITQTIAFLLTLTLFSTSSLHFSYEINIEQPPASSISDIENEIEDSEEALLLTEMADISPSGYESFIYLNPISYFSHTTPPLQRPPHS